MTAPLLSAIIVLTPMPAHWDQSTPMTWRFIGHPGPAAVKALTLGMFPLFKDPCDAPITVHLAGRSQTLLLLYPQTAGVLSLVTNDKGAILSADIAVNWKLKHKDKTRVLAQMVAMLRTDGLIHMQFQEAKEVAQ